MRYNLATLWRRKSNPRRREVVLREVKIPATLAGDLYQAGYAPVVAAWTNVIPTIVDAYERTLSAMTTDSPEQIGATLGAVESDIGRLMVSLRLRIASWAANVERVQRTKWRSAVLTATGVDVETMIGPADMRLPMSAAVERNVDLISSVSSQARSRISEAVFQGFQRRAHATEVAATIREAVSMSRRRSLNIASDQNVKLAAALNSERRREAGMDSWEWISSHKLHYRPEHHVRNGKRYTDATAPKDLPGMLPFCGCTERAVLSLDDEF